MNCSWQRLRFEKAGKRMHVKNIMIENLYHKPALKVDELYHTMMEYKEMIKPYVANTSVFFARSHQRG